MMFEPVDYPQSPSDHPHRQTVIERDEILSLKIDLEVLTPEEFHGKYFSVPEQD